MNIRLRLTIWYATILALILIIFSVAVYLGLSRSLFAALDNHLERESAQLIGGLRVDEAHHEDEEAEREHEAEDDERDEAQAKEESLSLQGTEIKLTYEPEEGVLWRILDRTGRLLVGHGDLAGVRVEPALLTSAYTHFDYVTLPDGTPVRLYSVPFLIKEKGGGLVQVGESYQNIQQVERLLLLLLAIGIPITLLAASAGGWFLAARALEPIDRITRAAQQISANDLHRRLNLDVPNDEVGRLAVTFDQMLARLQDAFERQKRFIADASHELRTPLTILKGDVEVTLHRPRSAGEYRETLEMVGQTTDRLTALVEELLLLARADNDQYPLQLEQVNLAELLTEQVTQLQPYALDKHITLTLTVPAELSLVADPAKLARLFLNLIDNAIKYSNPGDAVQVVAGRQEQQVWVTVADTGPGIASTHLPHLFERFYRVDKARSRSATAEAASVVSGSTGAGLGLPIAQWLAQAHGGHIEVTSQAGQGSTFTVRLPLSQTPAEASDR